MVVEMVKYVKYVYFNVKVFVCVFDCGYGYCFCQLGVDYVVLEIYYFVFEMGVEVLCLLNIYFFYVEC